MEEAPEEAGDTNAFGRAIDRRNRKRFGRADFRVSGFSLPSPKLYATADGWSTNPPQASESGERSEPVFARTAVRGPSDSRAPEGGPTGPTENERRCRAGWWE